MSLLLSEEVAKYREYEIGIMAKVINAVILNTDDDGLQFARGQMEAIKQIINLPNVIASTPEEKIYAKELIGKTRDMLANRISEKYLFDEK